MKLAILLSIIVLANSKPYLGRNDPDFGVICPESEDGYAVYVPHPTECNLYYECVGLTPVLLSCPGDLYFDPALNVCNWPDQVNCHPKTDTPETTTKVETTTAEKETTTEEKETTIEEKETTTAVKEPTTTVVETTTAEEETTITAKETTAAVVNQNEAIKGKKGDFPDFDVVCYESEDGLAVYVPHPTQCNLYYQCVGLTPFLLHCPGELFFDPTLNVCNWPDQVDCESQTEKITTEATTIMEQETSTTAGETTTTEVNTEVEEEEKTVNEEESTSVENENVKKVFKRSIDPDFDVVCPQSEDGTTVFVPHPTDCNLYYICVGKMPFLMQCPGDLYFDSVLNICNWPDLVNCETQITENPETTTIDTSNTTTIDTTNTTTTYVQSSTNEVKTTTIS